MKRWIIWGVLFVFVGSAVFAGRKKEGAGTIKDKVYQDAEFGFQVKLHDNWGAKVNKSDASNRIVLIQKNWSVPPQYSVAKDYTEIPHLAIFADTTSLSAGAFVDSMLSPNYKSKAKKELAKEFGFLELSDHVVKTRRVMTVAGKNAMLWQAERKYVKEISESMSSDAGIRVSGSLCGMMLAVKNGNTIVLFHMMCEANYLNDIMSEVKTMTTDDQALTWVSAGN